MEKWFVQTKKADFDDWSRKLGIDVVTARILRNRDIMTAEEAKVFLGGSVNDTHSPFLMKDMEKAASELIKAVADGKKIRVIGDYDVDGVTSSYILTKGIGLIGGNVDTAIPHRVHDGYGLSDSLVEEAAAEGVGLIVTCDNGISASPQVKKAVLLGMDVIVTDHHEVPFDTDADGKHIQILPEALAVVNPKRDDCTYPFKGICGAMVAYKLMQAVLDMLNGKTGLNEGAEAVSGEGAAERLEASMSELLEFAALGTVCDVMELKDENRIIVREGIKLIKRSANYGMQALMEVNGLDPEAVSAYHMGFVIGPCVNASGRLDSALRAFELFNAPSKREALIIANELKALNDSRKNLTNEGIKAAEEYISEHSLSEKAVWMIFLPDIHESIAGIIAGKIKEKYYHPTFILTRTEDEGMIKGSGRSIEGYHMQAHLMEAADMLDKFGGHAMAAGLSFKDDRLDELDRFLNDNAGLKEDDFAAKVMIDVPMPVGYASMKLAKELEKLEPFGTGNPTPLFADRELEITGMKRFGSDGKYARYTAKTSAGGTTEFTSFSDPEAFLSFVEEKYGKDKADELRNTGKASGVKVNIAYNLDINRYKGTEKLQFMMKHYS